MILRFLCNFACYFVYFFNVSIRLPVCRYFNIYTLYIHIFNTCINAESLVFSCITRASSSIYFYVTMMNIFSTSGGTPIRTGVKLLFLFFLDWSFIFLSYTILFQLLSHNFCSQAHFLRSYLQVLDMSIKFIWSIHSKVESAWFFFHYRECNRLWTRMSIWEQCDWKKIRFVFFLCLSRPSRAF